MGDFRDPFYKWVPYPKPDAGTINVFTDGSYWEGRSINGLTPRVAGWCTYKFETNEAGHTERKIDKGTCEAVCSMGSELYAIKKAFELFPGGVGGKIITDAEVTSSLLRKWADQGFRNSRKKHLKLRDERIAIWNLASANPDIEIIQVKGHSRISQQEETDRSVRKLVRKEVVRRGWDITKVPF